MNTFDTDEINFRRAPMQPNVECRTATLLGRWFVVLTTMTVGVSFAQAQNAPEYPCPRTLEAQHDEAELLRALIKCRLAIAYDVAQAKYNSGAHVEDKEREEAVIAAAAEQAALYGLPAASARAFWSAQIDASKKVQSLLIERWAADAHPAFPDAPDLAADVRPKLDLLTEAMTKTYANFYLLDPSDAGTSLGRDELPEESRFDLAVFFGALSENEYADAILTALSPVCNTATK